MKIVHESYKTSLYWSQPETAIKFNVTALEFKLGVWTIRIGIVRPAIWRAEYRRAYKGKIYTKGRFRDGYFQCGFKWFAIAGVHTIKINGSNKGERA